MFASCHQHSRAGQNHNRRFNASAFFSIVARNCRDHLHSLLTSLQHSDGKNGFGISKQLANRVRFTFRNNPGQIVIPAL